MTDEPMRRRRGDGHASQANKGKVKRRLKGANNRARKRRRRRTMRRLLIIIALLGALIAPNVAGATTGRVQPWGLGVSSNGVRCGASGAAGACTAFARSNYSGFTTTDPIGSAWASCVSSQGTGVHSYNFGNPVGSYNGQSCPWFAPTSFYITAPTGTGMTVYVRESCPFGGFAWSPNGSTTISTGSYSQYMGIYRVTKPAGGCQP